MIFNCFLIKLRCWVISTLDKGEYFCAGLCGHYMLGYVRQYYVMKGKFYCIASLLHTLFTIGPTCKLIEGLFCGAVLYSKGTLELFPDLGLKFMMKSKLFRNIRTVKQPVCVRGFSFN